MTNDVDTHTETLFTAEAALRSAARALFMADNNENRKALRRAAIAYAEASRAVDQAMDEMLARGTETP